MMVGGGRKPPYEPYDPPKTIQGSSMIWPSLVSTAVHCPSEMYVLSSKWYTHVDGSLLSVDVLAILGG